MTRATRLLALAALLGCSNLDDAGAGIVTVEVTVPVPAVVAVDSTLQLSARALDKDGAPVTAEIFWVTPDTTIAVDSATGLVTGRIPGLGRVQALSGSASSALISVTVRTPNQK